MPSVYAVTHPPHPERRESGMGHYFNEFDPGAAEWLRELMKVEIIPQGEVDERDIQDIAPDDLRGHRSVHLFAGIGVWSYALRLAGWPDDRPVWTCSCPCQPFSSAGKGDGFADERHLWPAAFHLLSECRPSVCFGEQVASDDGFAWLDLVQADLESVGYTVGAVVTPAAGYGAPHGRHRIYWVADATSDRTGRQGATKPSGNRTENGILGTNSRARSLANTNGGGRRKEGQRGRLPKIPGERPDQRVPTPIANPHGGLEHAAGNGRQQRRAKPIGRGAASGCGPCNGFWADAEWLHCAPEPDYPEGRWRPVEPGTFPLAHGAPGRVGRLRGYGNGLCAPQAAAFVRAWQEEVRA